MKHSICSSFYPLCLAWTQHVLSYRKWLVNDEEESWQGHGIWALPELVLPTSPHAQRSLSTGAPVGGACSPQ